MVIVVVVWLNLFKFVVSKCIFDFEVMLGVVLFWCNVGCIILIEVVQYLVECLCLVLVELVVVIESIVWDMDGFQFLCGVLLILVLMSFGIMYLGLIIVWFVVQNLELDISVDYDDCICDLVCEGFDIGICIGKFCDKVLMQCKLCEDEGVFCVSFVYLVVYGQLYSMIDLCDYYVISYSYVLNNQVWQFQDYEWFVLFMVNSCILLNNGEVICEMVLQGLGLVMLLGFIVVVEIVLGWLVWVLIDYFIWWLFIVVVWLFVLLMFVKL